MNHQRLTATLLTISALAGCQHKPTLEANSQAAAPKTATPTRQPAAATIQSPEVNAVVAPVSMANVRGTSSKALSNRNQIFSAIGLPTPMAHLSKAPKYQVQVRQSNTAAASQPVSTFAVDVDTGSYANVRRHISGGALPPKFAVRPEEMTNYFRYDVLTKQPNQPLALSASVGVTPWNSSTRLLRITLDVPDETKSALPPANMVLLIDVSGSMQSPERLPLLKQALSMLVKNLRPVDRISIVTYAGKESIALAGVKGDETEKILATIQNLESGGSTNGHSGLKAAYQLARANFIDQGVNRVLLATDGDFNVGMSNVDDLIDYVKSEKKSGVSLSTLGVGDLNEELMERLADSGDGNYAYVDTLLEAQKVLVDEFRSNWTDVARDAKVQVEFNAANVATYRLIGYENRMLREEDFRNDRVDAGDIGLGHQVTALYEVTLNKDLGKNARRYDGKAKSQMSKHVDELAEVRVRYKHLPTMIPKELAIRVPMNAADKDLDSESKFAAAVSAFAQELSQANEYLNGFSFDEIAQLASDNKGADPIGHRAEFIRLVKLSKHLAGKR